MCDVILIAIGISTNHVMSCDVTVASHSFIVYGESQSANNQRASLQRLPIGETSAYRYIPIPDQTIIITTASVPDSSQSRSDDNG